VIKSNFFFLTMPNPKLVPKPDLGPKIIISDPHCRKVKSGKWNLEDGESPVFRVIIKVYSAVPLLVNSDQARRSL
jgi:hypothetical protein